MLVFFQTRLRQSLAKIFCDHFKTNKNFLANLDVKGLRFNLDKTFVKYTLEENKRPLELHDKLSDDYFIYA